MKTSNKILIGFLTALFIFSISILTYLKANTVEFTMIDSVGEVKTVTYNFPHLHTFEAEAGNIQFLNGDPKVEIICAENVKQYFDSGYEEGKFYIRKKEGVENDLDIKVKVYADSLTKLTLLNRAKAHSYDSFKSRVLSIETYNSTFLNMKLETEVLNISSYNYSKFYLQDGNTKILNANLYNSAKVNTGMAKIMEVDASVFNSAELTVHPLEKLSVTITNDGEVNYSGDPEIGRQNISQSGKLKKENTIYIHQ